MNTQATSHLLDPLILGTSFYQDGVVATKTLGSVTDIWSNLKIKHFVINILIPLLLILLMIFVVKYLYNKKRNQEKLK